jgi:hypothetical protein
LLTGQPPAAGSAEERFGRLRRFSGTVPRNLMLWIALAEVALAALCLWQGWERGLLGLIAIQLLLGCFIRPTAQTAAPDRYIYPDEEKLGYAKCTRPPTLSQRLAALRIRILGSQEMASLLRQPFRRR